MDDSAEATGAIALSGQNSQSVVRVVSLIMSEDSDAIVLVISVPAVSCQSPHV